jgi:hypothetical protein
MTARWFVNPLLWVPVLVLATAGAVHAQLAAPVRGLASGDVVGSELTFYWNPVPAATWYHLIVQDPTGVKLNTWHTAGQAHCGAGEPGCYVKENAALAPGVVHWWVQAYNGAYSPWSARGEFNAAAATSLTVTFGPGASANAVGSIGGTAFGLISCPSGQLAVGVIVRAGNDMDAFGLKCAPISSLRFGPVGAVGTTGTVTDTQLAGNPSGGVQSDLMCPAGFVVTGADGSFTGSINALRAHCMRIGGGDVALTAYGGIVRASTVYTAACPTGTAVTGFSGRAGQLVDRLTFRCQ